MSDNKTNQHLAEISAKMDKMSKLLALNLVKDMKKQREQIAFLSDAGFQPKEIANILSTSSGNVRVALHAIRKERESPKEEDTHGVDEAKLGQANGNNGQQ